MQKKLDNSETTKLSLSRYKLVPHRISQTNCENIDGQKPISVNVQIQNKTNDRDSDILCEVKKVTSIGDNLAKELMTTREAIVNSAKDTSRFTLVMYIVAVSALVITWVGMKLAALTVMISLQNTTNATKSISEINYSTGVVDIFILFMLAVVTALFIVYGIISLQSRLSGHK
ncbi:MAG: hypothetical protein O0V67_03870 [Methanocorpusculum sp.]|nr:hypothetical protein [Methanocorpusculum sp.]